MTLPEVVDCAAGASMTVTSPIAHRCPYVAEADAGTVTISWLCDGRTVELHSLAGYFDGYADVQISHEDLVAAIHRDISALVGEVSVSARFTTAGMGVEVYALPGEPQHRAGA